MPTDSAESKRLRKRKAIIESLHRSLESALPNRALVTRSMQIACAKILSPLIVDWVSANGSQLVSELGFAIPEPDEASEYRRNGVFFPYDNTRIGIYTHVWKSGGVTPIHAHDDLLALA